MLLSTCHLARPAASCRLTPALRHPPSRIVVRSFHDVDSHATLEEQPKPVIDLFHVAKSQSGDFASSFTGKAEEILEVAKDKWSTLEDKPTVIATVAGSLLALYIVSGIVERLDALPGVSNVFQLIGFLTSGYAALRYVASEEDRSKIHSSVTGLLKRVGL